MTADFVGNDRAVVEHQQRLHHRRPTEHMHFPPQCLLDPCCYKCPPNYESHGPLLIGVNCGCDRAPVGPGWCPHVQIGVR